MMSDMERDLEIPSEVRLKGNECPDNPRLIDIKIASLGREYVSRAFTMV